MATEYPFSSLPQNRHCFGEAGVALPPCPNFPCLHTPCQDPDYLADQEDNFRDPAYHIRLWWEYHNEKELGRVIPVPPQDEETRLRLDEESRMLDKWYRAMRESKDIKLAVPQDSEEAQQYNVTKPISEEERKDFESKFARCRRVELKKPALQRDIQRFYTKQQLEQLKALDRCPNKDTQVYREAAEYRDQILASVAETGDYLFGWPYSEAILGK